MLVCDGAKPLSSATKATGNGLISFRLRRLRTSSSTRDLGTDRQGDQSQGSARSATPGTDWHDHAEEVFLSQIADKLDGLIRDNDVINLTFVAPPRVLGILRKCARPSAGGAVTAEVAKDVVKFPIPEIEHYLSE